MQRISQNSRPSVSSTATSQKSRAHKLTVTSQIRSSQVLTCVGKNIPSEQRDRKNSFYLVPEGCSLIFCAWPDNKICFSARKNTLQFKTNNTRSKCKQPVSNLFHVQLGRKTIITTTKISFIIRKNVLAGIFKHILSSKII